MQQLAHAIIVSLCTIPQVAAYMDFHAMPKMKEKNKTLLLSEMNTK